ncbi:MAG: SDR family NAD(P)-dependent oxidoreductase [Akkermansiaceae bacterium]|nr:SDR family NAD(P)-dependent oxidoreductase [Armatimonadota bacterium]
MNENTNTGSILAGKTVLIAGATGGIGSAAALQLAQQGARLLLSGRNEARLQTLAGQIEYATGAEPDLFAADLSDPVQSTRLVEAAQTAFGQAPDVVINAAGVGAIRPVEALTPDDFQTLIATNLLGAMYLSQAAVRVMAPRKSGHILHVVGILGKAPMANATAYCASKYGLTGFLSALRAEISRRYNIKVTGLYLGGVDTPFYDNPAVEMKVQRDKMLSADDAANAIVYALSQPSHLVLGELTLQPDSHQL